MTNISALRRLATAMPNKLCGGNHKAIAEEGDQEYLEGRSGVRNGDSRGEMEPAAEDRTGWR